MKWFKRIFNLLASGVNTTCLKIVLNLHHKTLPHLPPFLVFDTLPIRDQLCIGPLARSCLGNTTFSISLHITSGALVQHFHWRLMRRFNGKCSQSYLHDCVTELLNNATTNDRHWHVLQQNNHENPLLFGG